MLLSWIEVEGLKQKCDYAKSDGAEVIVLEVEMLSELVENYDRYGQFHAGLDERVRDLEALNQDLESELAGTRAEADAATAGLAKCRDTAIQTLELIEAGTAVKA